MRFILWSELLLRWRTSQEWLYPLIFFMILMVIFPLAFTADPVFLEKYLPGYLWVAALLANLLVIPTFFLSDIEGGHLEQLLFSALPLPLILLMKLSAQWIVITIPLMIFIPLLGLIFHLSYFIIGAIWISLLLGTPIFVGLGSLGAALTLGLRQSGVLLCVLILPLIIPVLIFGINIVKQAALDMPIVASCAMLAGLTILSCVLLPFAIASALQLSLED